MGAAGRATNLRAVVQRVVSARVLVAGEMVGEIGAGLCVLLGLADADDLNTAGRLAQKIVRLRIFENEEGKFDRLGRRRARLRARRQPVHADRR